MSKLDGMLEQLGAQPAPAALSQIDGPILAALAPRRERDQARRSLLVASGVALLVGAGAAGLPESPARAEPLLGVPAAAPSHLLGD